MTNDQLALALSRVGFTRTESKIKTRGHAVPESDETKPDWCDLAPEHRLELLRLFGESL